MSDVPAGGRTAGRGAGRRWTLPAAGAGLVFAGWATATSWQALADRRAFDLPLRAVAVVGIVSGGLLWWRGSGTGRLVLGTAAAFFARDLRASGDEAVFVLGFCLAYLWLGFAAHVIVSWPTGRLTGRSPRALVALCYLLAVGSQVGRYAADRPRAGWLYDHPPGTLWAHIGSACAAGMAVAVTAAVLWRWKNAPPARRPAEPVWLVFIVVAVSSAAAAVASIAGVPDGQIELIPAALALTMAAPAAWTYARMHAQLQEVSASRRRVAIAANEERRRIQADLHDGAQQALAAVQLRLGSALHTMAGPTPAAAEPQTARAYQELTDAIGSLRDLVQKIYPAVLRDYGLLAALEDLADRSAIPLIMDVDPVRWADEVEVTAYFVIREAVGNSMRHAAPDRIRVLVRDHSSALLRVEVDDDGRGEAVPLRDGGLRNLHDRVSAAGGTVEMTSSPAAGTRVTVLLPKEVPGARRSG